MSKNAKTSRSVIAVVREDAMFKAVALRQQNDDAEVHWARQMPADGQTWEAFASECGLAAGKHRGDTTVVLGLDPATVAFYRINAPNVGQDEIAAIVQMQAESLLPLPPSQIEVAWRTSPSTNGTVDVTIAAARSDALHRLAGEASAFRPQAILPACEGTARTWHELFSERERQALVVSIGAHNTQVCHVSHGYVTNAAVLDVGMDNLAIVAAESVESSEGAKVIERFVQDMRAVLESFAWTGSPAWPMLVLSDGSDDIAQVVEALNQAGLNAKASVPRAEVLGMPTGLEAQGFYEYRVPLGLALMALDGATETLDLFERMTEVEHEKKAKSAWYSTTLAAILVILMLVVFIATWCAVDVISERRLGELVSQPQFEEARQRQILLKTVARHRPDLLALLTDINEGQNDGVVLDSLHFKKGQTVSVVGRAGNTDQMWKFQENLRQRKGIKNVLISNSAKDAKTKKIKFTMVFHYKSFTKKDAVL